MAIIYQTTSLGDATLRVALVDQGAADLLVYRTSTMGMAHGDALWFITRDRNIATARMCLTSQGFAEVKICFVDSQALTGWQRPHRLRGRIG